MLGFFCFYTFINHFVTKKVFTFVKKHSMYTNGALRYAILNILVESKEKLTVTDIQEALKKKNVGLGRRMIINSLKELLSNFPLPEKQIKVELVRRVKTKCAAYFITTK